MLLSMAFSAVPASDENQAWSSSRLKMDFSALPRCSPNRRKTHTMRTQSDGAKASSDILPVFSSESDVE